MAGRSGRNAAGASRKCSAILNLTEFSGFGNSSMEAAIVPDSKKTYGDCAREWFGIFQCRNRPRDSTEAAGSPSPRFGWWVREARFRKAQGVAARPTGARVTRERK